MIVFRADTRAKNAEGIYRAKKRLEEALNKQYRKKVLAMFKDLLNISPQYSGDFASNWQILPDNGSPMGYRAWRNKGAIQRGETPAQMGDSEAIDFAFTRAKFVKYDYRQKVYFVNDTPLEFTPTTVTGDGVTHNLRPVNQISPPQMMVSFLKARYSLK